MRSELFQQVSTEPPGKRVHFLFALLVSVAACATKEPVKTDAGPEKPTTTAPAPTASAPPSPVPTAPVPTPQPSSPAAVASPRLLNETERAEVSRVLHRFSVDFAQTFHVNLNGFGDCFFASTTYKENNVGDFLIVQGDRVSLVLPKNPSAESWTRSEVKAVAFTSLDDDAYTDVVAIAEYMTGIGPTGAVPFPVVFYYHGTGPKSFRLDEATSNSATEKKVSSIAAAKKHIGR